MATPQSLNFKNQYICRYEGHTHNGYLEFPQKKSGIYQEENIKVNGTIGIVIDITRIEYITSATLKSATIIRIDSITCLLEKQEILIYIQHQPMKSEN